LGSHRGGVRHYSNLPQWWMGWHEAYSTRHYATVAEGLELILGDALLFAPGSGFEYSTFGYSLLSRLMEGATGQPFAQILAQEVLRPAALHDTAIDLPGEMPARVAFYTTDSGRYTAAYPIDSSYKIAGGGLVSTPSDLVRLGVALLGNELIGDAEKQLLWTPLALDDGSMNPQNYALGWRVDVSERLLGADRPTRILHHGGTQEGAAAFYLLLPEHGIAVAAMTNTAGDSARAEVQELCYALVRLAVARTSTAAPTTAPPSSH
jgi:CubicO group peptidase (beta-lactamase class C family)